MQLSFPLLFWHSGSRRRYQNRRTLSSTVNTSIIRQIASQEPASALSRDRLLARSGSARAVSECALARQQIVAVRSIALGVAEIESYALPIIADAVEGVSSRAAVPGRPPNAMQRVITAGTPLTGDQLHRLDPRLDRARCARAGQRPRLGD
jgi:hypothetical protein